MKKSAKKILVVGAGVMGANLAFRLARAGAKVTVLEADQPASGATGASFGWINASFYLNPAHHNLRVAAMAAHHRLAADLPAYAPNWQGTLWWEDEGAGFDAMLADLTALGYPIHPLTAAELARAEPALHAPPSRALHLPTEGAADPTALTQALLAASGATILTDLPATRLILDGNQITGLRTPKGPMQADHIVLAAGTATPALLRSARIDMRMLPRPGLILRTNPVTFRLNHILVTPRQEIRQLPDGSLLTPCAASHQGDNAETIPDPDAAAAATIAHLTTLFGPVTLAETRLGHRPMPADGMPALGQVAPGLSLAVMHSGITLAPLAAEALTSEIMGQGTHPLWSAYSPNRLAAPI